MTGQKASLVFVLTAVLIAQPLRPQSAATSAWDALVGRNPELALSDAVSSLESNRAPGSFDLNLFDDPDRLIGTLVAATASWA